MLCASWPATVGASRDFVTMRCFSIHSPPPPRAQTRLLLPHTSRPTLPRARITTISTFSDSTSQLPSCWIRPSVIGAVNSPSGGPTTDKPHRLHLLLDTAPRRSFCIIDGRDGLRFEDLVVKWEGSRDGTRPMTSSFTPPSFLFTYPRVLQSCLYGFGQRVWLLLHHTRLVLADVVLRKAGVSVAELYAAAVRRRRHPVLPRRASQLDGFLQIQQHVLCEATASCLASFCRSRDLGAGYAEKTHEQRLDG
ncbi:hypothetical protein MSAN_01368900 [Mycena sanguinolenta]|uniref:Uncharacterized protein n=1 Tax=Mycena sanguinolenta TaxID=230812 RepID=A0A8H6Y5G2_9AGAR|nr:hypothetical protein MSAN_01368900 [Mycena sanguinolenta]